MGVGSYLPAFNKVQILRMNENHGIVKELEIAETWPISKILWLPKQEEGMQPELDFLCTASDWLRLYPLQRDESDGLFKRRGECIELINRSEYCQPITSFDWNQLDPNTIASASIDSSVTIWSIEQQEITTQLVAHDKAVYDISFSLE